MSAAKIARRGVLAQQLNAIESLASVSVMCTDKTGTLTEAALRVVALVPADGVTEAELDTLFGRYAASSSARNATLQAIHDADLTGDGDASAVEPVRAGAVLVATALERAGARLRPARAGRARSAAWRSTGTSARGR